MFVLGINPLVDLKMNNPVLWQSFLGIFKSERRKILNNCNLFKTQVVLVEINYQLKNLVMIEMLIPIALFTMIFGIVYVSRTAQNREILAAIDKGMDPQSVNLNMFKKKNSTLKTGALLVGVALGLLAGYMLINVTSMDPPLAYMSMSFLLGGVALLIVHYIESKGELENPSLEI